MKNDPYGKGLPKAGQRNNEGQRQLKERIKRGNMHTYYGFPDTKEGKAEYKSLKKEYGLH
tara:strand:+ start:285 stop:464 length:180 start_codon:yes stop_codon:yes gene_type:complete